MGYDIKDIYRDFREKYRDSDEMKALYRKLREVRDEFVKSSAAKADEFVDYFKSLPFDDQIELLTKLYEFLFGKS